MKILGIYRGNGGSYHRVKLPLEQIEKYSQLKKENIKIVIKETIDEDILKKHNPDIILIHWTSPISIPELSVLKSKYNFKVIADIDDSWNVNKKDEKLIVSAFQSKNLVLFADYVFCTNEKIAEDIKKINSNVFIIPNYIPKDFIVNKNWEDKDKITVGIYGSISHFNSWKTNGYIINNMKYNNYLVDNVRFVIIGYEETDEWKQIKELFTIKDKTQTIEPIIYNAVSPEKSIELIDNLDIMIFASENTDIFEARSNLKLYECCARGCIPVADTGYQRKHAIYKLFDLFSSYSIEATVKNIFSENAYFSKTLTNIQTVNNSYDYIEDAVKPRITLFKRLLITSEKEFINERNAIIYSVVYDNKQTGEYTRYLNNVSSIRSKSYLFEYNPMIFLSTFIERGKYFGVFSWKFPYKTGFYKKLIYRAINKEYVSDKTDVLIFCKPIVNYLATSEIQHPGLLRILAKVCSKLDLKISEPTNVVYSNFFVAKGEIYQKYINTVIKPAIEFMENDPEIKSLVWNNANYSGGLSSEELKKYTELPHYTFHTFVLERLFSIWLENNKEITVKTFY